MSFISPSCHQLFCFLGGVSSDSIALRYRYSATLLWKSEGRSVVSNYLQLHGLYSPWNSPGQNTGVGSLSLLQGIFPTQGSNPGLLHCRWILYCLSHQGSPWILEWVAYLFSRGSSQPRDRTQVSCTAGGFFTIWPPKKPYNTLRSHNYNLAAITKLTRGHTIFSSGLNRVLLFEIKEISLVGSLQEILSYLICSTQGTTTD